MALGDTLDHLDEAGIARAGAGSNRNEALEPACLSIAGLRGAVVSITDNLSEYAATESTPGAAHIDIYVDDSISRSLVRTSLSRAVDTDPDLIVASLYWEPNMVEQSLPAFQQFDCWLVEQDDDTTHGHSAHIIHEIEVTGAGPIIYDAGDFVDDYAVDDELRNDRSFLFVLECHDDGQPPSLRLEPIEIYDLAVHEAGSEAATWCRERMHRLSRSFDTTFERDGPALVVNPG